MQLIENIREDTLRRRRGDGHDRRSGKATAEDVKIPIVRPEIVSPFRNAVRFIDNAERDVQSRKKIEKAGNGEPLGSNVKKFIFAAFESPHSLIDFEGL